MPAERVMLIRERIRDLMDTRGLKYVAVAARMGRDKDWMSTRLTGKVQILAEELPLFAKELDVHPCDFFESRSPDPPISGWAQDLARNIRERIEEGPGTSPTPQVLHDAARVIELLAQLPPPQRARRAEVGRRSRMWVQWLVDVSAIR